MRFDLDLQGVPEVVQLLERWPVKVQNEILRDALTKAAVPILAQAQSNLATQVRVTGQRSDPIRTGLRIRAGRRRRRGVVRRLVQTPRRAQLGISKESRWYYPAHIELGTRDTPAKPYLRPALLQQRERVIEIIRQEVARSLEALRAP
jgi:HK97 gp10 family phage protein